MKKLMYLASNLRYPEDYIALTLLTIFSVLAALAKYLHGSKEPVVWRVMVSKGLMALTTSYLLYSLLFYYMGELSAWPTIGIAVLSGLYWPELLETSRTIVKNFDPTKFKGGKQND